MEFDAMTNLPAALAAVTAGPALPVDGALAEAAAETAGPATPAPAGQPSAAPRRTNGRYDQDRLIAQEIETALQEILAVQAEPQLIRRLADYGFTAAHLDEGLALQAAAQAAYTERQQAQGAQREAYACLDSCRQTAMRLYTNFRQQARTVCTSQADRTSLTLFGTAPKNTRRFLTQARTAYATAGQPEFAAPLASAGFGRAQLAAAEASLEALETAIHAANAASQRAVQSTASRDTAAIVLRSWIQRLCTLKRVAQSDYALRSRANGAGQTLN